MSNFYGKYPPGGGGGGSQTPWTSNIDGAGYALNEVSSVGFGTNAVNGSWRIIKDGSNNLLVQQLQASVWTTVSEFQTGV